ncbi:MAG: MFS transporter [Aliidongia sp.]
MKASYADPVMADAESSDALYSRIAWRIMPILFVGYIVAYLDRVNVGFAKLQMIGDLKFSDSVYGVGAGIFFWGYFFFEVPSNLILHKIGARIWICRVLVVWGIVSALTAFVTTPFQFYAVRFLLGVAEAGFFPGMVLYLTYWFPSHRRAKMMALLMAGNPVSGLLGGPLSGFIMHSFEHGTGWAGWQWLFVIEAVPAVLLGIVVFFYLDDRVAGAKWLSATEKSFVASEIEAEAKVKTEHSVRAVFVSARVWLMCAILFGIVMGSYAIGFWQPTIIQQTGIKDPFMVGLLTMVPYALALASMILTGRHADRTRERRWHVATPAMMAALGFILCTQAGTSTIIAVAGLAMAVAGVVTALPMFWALPTSFLGGSAAAAGIALINCTGNLAGFFSPTIIGVLKDYTGTLSSGLLLVACCLLGSALLILTQVPAKLVNR